MYYAQDNLDKWLVEHLILPDKGVIVDVGAGDGVNMSNSKHLEDKGWKAICIDADPRVKKALHKNRLHAHSVLISTKKDKQTFYMNADTPDISGIIKTKGNSDKSTELIPTTLEAILKKEKIGKIDILSIDTEGTEIDVFESMDWEVHKPRYLVIEFDTQGTVNLEVEPYFTKLGYKAVAIHGPNMIFELPQPIVKDPHLMVWGSSYDRGLDHLLKMWGDIKKEVPDARLRIFYGWNLFDAVYHDNAERQAWKAKINELMEQDGITHLGRISHGAVNKEFEMAGIWAYPTHFGEISCITAMKAQAYGAIPCVIDYAALTETVQFGVKVRGDIYDKETQELYKNALIALLNDEKHQEAIRPEMMAWAKENFAWKHVATQWDKEFKRKITPDEQALRLILADEPLEALKLLKEDSPLKQKLLKKLDHIFNYDKYVEKYGNDPMNWKAEDVWYDRYDWILKEAEGAKTLIDLGCYEGHLVDKFGKGAKGVEICKAAKDPTRNIVTGDALTYSDGKKYDAVVACELIEHVPDPKVLIENMFKLVSDDGWCYVTTPNGCFDSESTLKVWNEEDALIDHVRTFNKDSMEALLAGCDVKIEVKDKNLYVKFRRNLDKAVEELLDNNQALQAWDLVKDTDWPKKDRLWLRVKHAFDKEAYDKYYGEQLIEEPKKEETALDCTNLYPRFTWLINDVLKKQYKSVVDLGCADGYLSLTLANKGVECYGVNLYEPSVKLANERAKKHNLPAVFETKDIMKCTKKADAVILFEVLEHVPNPQEMIDHCMSLVNEGGSFYLSTPSPQHVGIEQHKEEAGRQSGDWDDGLPSGHLRIFTQEELKKLFSKYKVEQFLLDEHKCFLLEVKNNGK